VEEQKAQDNKQINTDSEAVSLHSVEVTEALNNMAIVPAQTNSLQRLKMVSGDLLDIWLYEGSKALVTAKETRIVQGAINLDPMDKYRQIYERVSEGTEQLVGRAKDVAGQA